MSPSPRSDRGSAHLRRSPGFTAPRRRVTIRRKCFSKRSGFSTSGMDVFFESLIARAATIDELLSEEFAALPGQEAHADLAARRFAAWCRSCASGDWLLFNRRLERDRLSIAQVLARFATVRRRAGAPMPAWIDDAIWIGGMPKPRQRSCPLPSRTKPSLVVRAPARAAGRCSRYAALGRYQWAGRQQLERNRSRQLAAFTASKSLPVFALRPSMSALIKRARPALRPRCRAGAACRPARGPLRSVCREHESRWFPPAVCEQANSIALDCRHDASVNKGLQP